MTTLVGFRHRAAWFALAGCAAAWAPPAAAAPEPPRWQQSADYRLEVELDPDARVISGRETLTYLNRSPDTLRALTFHLYHRAVRPGTELDRAHRRGDRWDVADLEPSRWGECEVESARVDGQPRPFVPGPDPSLGVLELPGPLAPGDSVRAVLSFVDRFPGINVHDGFRGREFFAGEWFPKVAVYAPVPGDPSRGAWHADPYAGRGEFFADFGSYEVALTLPASYLVVATGSLLNPDEVLPSEVRLRLRGLGEREVLVWERPGPPESDRNALVTWRLGAERVHDFAFAAMESFTWRALRRDGVTVSAVCPPGDAGTWAGAPGWAAEVLADLAARLGPYPHDHLDLVGTRALSASIEKPALVWISRAHYADTRSRRFQEVLAHEVAHQWFYGTVANDEAREAFLDEGPATWLALKSVERRYGGTHNLRAPGGALARLLVTPDDQRSEHWRALLDWERRGGGEPMGLPADSFATQTAYIRAVYTRGALMLDALERRLGPQHMEQALRDYASRWSFGHPTTADFLSAMESSTGEPLDSFFGFWLGGVARAHPPAEEWRGGVALQFANGVARLQARRVDRATLWWRPMLTYNRLDGAGAGLRLRLEPPDGGWTLGVGGALPTRSLEGALRPWLDGSAAFRFAGRTLRGELALDAARGEGRSRSRGGVTLWLQPDPARTPRYAVRAGIERWLLFHPEYLRHREGSPNGDSVSWGQTTWDVSAAGDWMFRSLAVRPEFQARGSMPSSIDRTGGDRFVRFSGALRLHARRGGADRARVRLAAGTLPTLEVRAVLPTDPGPRPIAAPQELFRLAGAGPHEEFDHALARSRGVFDTGGHVVVAGGAGVRGYFDRDVVSRRFAAANLEAPLARAWFGPESMIWSGLDEPRRPQVVALVFADAARLGGVSGVDGAGATYADAGFSLVGRGLPWDLTVRLDFPVWLSRPAGGEGAVRARWLLSLGSLF
ncbi:MAG: M1 family metallopeptidase [Candidatus Eisenbacteria bacterium]|nr:M1 family metallopeptidase [Candidatus Eisenbacteria bacterium]